MEAEVLNNKQITVRSSHGELIISASSGRVISKVIIPGSEDEWVNRVTKVDLQEYKNYYNIDSIDKLPDSIDILDLGLQYSNGDTCEADNYFRENVKLDR